MNGYASFTRLVCLSEASETLNRAIWMCLGVFLDSTGCTDMQAGVWIRMGNAPNITLAQQKVVEAPSS